MQEAMGRFGLPKSEMQNSRVCVTVEEEEANSTGPEIPPVPVLECGAAVPTKSDILEGLTKFQLKPPGLRGAELFAHMCRYRNMWAGGGKHTSVDTVGEVFASEGAFSVIAPTDEDLRLGSIMKERVIGKEWNITKQQLSVL